MSTRPNVRDVYGEDFKQLCLELAESTRPYDPDLIVGIETGGVHVARLMTEHLTRSNLVTVRLQRPATKYKSHFRLDKIVARLPQKLVDAMRWMEVEAREVWLARRPHRPEPEARDMVTSADLNNALKHAERILIVDDTVDSGRTLSVTRHAVHLVHPTATVKTAVLASTWRRPPVTPDYCLFNRTLLRMPWSHDANE